MTTADLHPNQFHLPGIGSDSNVEGDGCNGRLLTPGVASPACFGDKGKPPYMMLRLYSSVTDAATDESSDIGTPMKEDTLPFFLDSPTEDKLDRMLNMLKDDEEFDPFKDVLNGRPCSKDDLNLRRKRNVSSYLRRRSISCCNPTHPTIEEGEEEEEEDPLPPIPSPGGDNTGSPPPTQGGFTLYSCLKGPTSPSPDLSPTHSGVDVHTSSLTLVHQTTSNTAILEMLGDSSGSENDIPVARRLWRIKSHSLHSGSTNSDPLFSGVLQDVDTDDLLIRALCDFESPQLIPDRLIPDHLAHARPTYLAQSFMGTHVSPPSHINDAPPTSRRQSSEDQEEIEHDIPLGGTAETFSSIVKTSPTPRKPTTTVPIPISCLPDTPYYPYYPMGQPLETVVEETASQLSPSGSPRISPRHSIDNGLAQVAEGKQIGNLLSVPQTRKNSLPLSGQPQPVPPSRDGYKLSIESLKSYHSYHSADTIYFSITSYDDDEDVPVGPGGQNQPPSPRSRKKATSTAPDSKLLQWLQYQPSVHELDDNEQPWPFNERPRSASSGLSTSDVSDLHRDTPPTQCDAPPTSLSHLPQETLQLPVSEPSGTDSFISFQQDSAEESSQRNGETSSYDDALEEQSDSSPYFFKLSRVSQTSTIRRMSVSHRESNASTVIMTTPRASHASCHTHRASAGSEATLRRQTLDFGRESACPSELQKLSLDQSLLSQGQCPNMEGLGSSEEHNQSLEEQDVSMTTDSELQEVITCNDNDSHIVVTDVAIGNTVTKDNSLGRGTANSSDRIQNGQLLSNVCFTSGDHHGNDCHGSPKLSEHPVPSSTGLPRQQSFSESSCIDGRSESMESEPKTSSKFNEDLLQVQSLLKEREEDIVRLRESHVSEVLKMTEQMEALRLAGRADKEVMESKMAALIEERDSLSSQVKQLQQSHGLDWSEGDDPVSTFSHKIEAMTKEEEFKEKESLLKKNWKVMDPLQREKSLAGSGVQESTSTKRQELIEKEARLLKDKSALSEDDKRHSLVVNDLSRKFQICQEELKTTSLQLEEAKQNLWTTKEEMAKTAKKELKAALLREKFVAQKELKDALEKERETHREEVSRIQKRFEERMSLEQEKGSQLRLQIAELKMSLDTERRLSQTLQTEKQTALARARETSQEELLTLNKRLLHERKQEADQLAGTIQRLEAEIARRKADGLVALQREKDLVQQMEKENRSLLSEITTHCQKIAVLTECKQNRQSSAKESMLPSNKLAAVSLLQKMVDNVHSYISELRAQVERPSPGKLLREKDERTRKTKSQGLKNQDGRAAMECDLSKKHHPNSVLPDCVRMITDGTQTSDDLLIRPLKLAIKMEEQRHSRTKALLSERTAECGSLQVALKHLNKVRKQVVMETGCC
jgi:hypothetical protein